MCGNRSIIFIRKRVFMHTQKKQLCKTNTDSLCFAQNLKETNKIIIV